MKNNIVEIENEVREFELAERKAKAYATSLMIPPHLRDLGSMMILNQLSKDFNIPVLTLAQNVYMVKGNLGISGQLVIALVNKTEYYDYNLEWETRENPWGVRAVAYKDKRKITGIWIDEKMIVENGWYNNPNWKTNKQLMAQYRAATYFARLNLPTALMGMQTNDELIDVSVAEPITDENIVDINNALLEDEEETQEQQKETNPTPTIDEAVLEPQEQDIEVLGDISEAEECQDNVTVIEEDYEAENQPMRATKKVASFYPEMMSAGVRRSHLSTVVKYYKLNDNNIEPFMENIERMVEEFYAHHTNLTRAGE